MSEPKLISPMLDNFVMGDPISDQNGVRCCPAMERDADNKYIVKIVSIPAQQAQLEALLLSGAFSTKEDALSYYKTIAEGVVCEAQTLQTLSNLEGFICHKAWQVEPMEDGNGYDVYLLSDYKRTLQRLLRNGTMTHLAALNLGLDLCAALESCRRAGYLYVDLKPSNIYITGEQEYRIGDIGFMKLDSLKYASLPDRYRSQYTAPEIADAFSALNTTIDVYALGLVLYQVFNDGNLPFKDQSAPAEELAPPAYADYEMAEIIMKACNPDPDQRWQDPVEMGQALVSYMQRNGAHDTPITPALQPAEPQETCENPQEDTQVPSQENSTPADEVESIIHEVMELEQNPEDITEASIYSEDNEGNLTFLETFSDDETSPDNETEEINYEEVSDEVSDMLSQADELIAHQAPDPVVQPEPIDVPIPEPIVVEEAEPSEEAKDADPDGSEEADEAEIEEDNSGDETQSVADGEEDTAPVKKKRARGWIRGVILVLLALALVAAGVLYYRNFYLQPIDSISVQEFKDGSMTVLVTSSIDDSKLSVVCSDTYGNKLTEPVINGKATFTGLAPNAAYTVKVDIQGFHRLTGDTSAAYTTPNQTNIVQFTAVTGTEDGSVVLGFAVDGTDAEQWMIQYTNDEGAVVSNTFSGHVMTVNGLTVGSSYTFTLSPVDDLEITGIQEVTHTASKIIKADSVMITGFTKDTLTAGWTIAEGISVESWTVRCYNDSGYDKTVTATEMQAQFEIEDPSAAYTVEVTAFGMSVSERAYVTKNSTTVTNFKAEHAGVGKLLLSWDCDSAAPADGWVLLYTLNGSAPIEIKCGNETQAEISPVVPAGKYTFTLQTSGGNTVVGGVLSYTAEEAGSFSGYGTSADKMDFRMCKTPEDENWNHYYLYDSDYTTEFSIGQSASFVIYINGDYEQSTKDTVSLFVIRDENGNIVNASATTQVWSDMWLYHYCEIDVPVMPKTAGKYTVSIYFDQALAEECSFTVVE